MYGALWRVLPGPWWVRVLFLVVLATLVIVALCVWVFPWVEPLFATDNVTVDTP